MGDDQAIGHARGEADYFALPTVAETVVDTTGAGDAFSGGALYGYARAGSALEAMLRGSVSASFAVAAYGSAGLSAATEDEAPLPKRLRPEITHKGTEIIGALRTEALVNWCPKCATVLANEQVVEGCCWRHETTAVEQRALAGAMQAGCAD